MIYFDASEDLMRVQLQSPLRTEVLNEIDLQEIQRAYLFKGDDEETQIVLVGMNGEEMGLSAFSKDSTPWKEDIVIAINAILYEAHKKLQRQEEPEEN